MSDDGTINGQMVSITVSCPSVTGSIHSGGNVTGIKVKGPALVTAGGGTITLDPSSEGAIQEIKLYTLAPNYQTKMNKNIERLLNERAIEWPSNNTNLCQPLDTSCETHKEGGVFKTKNTTSLGDILVNKNFNSQGTLIIQDNTGTLVLQNTKASVFQNKYFGIIVPSDNPIIIDGNVSTTSMDVDNILLYAPNSAVTFTGSKKINYTGLIIAKSITFQNKDVSITYPPNLLTALHLPPGFAMISSGIY
ncbi:hypothetical protein HY373_01710 [Candidatus Berkelbacteria bacterium]|nr:hypothetical protein [Candidatus Berkelbacteria bacterium]